MYCINEDHTDVEHEQQSYDVWFLKYWVWEMEFFVISYHFLPSYPHNNPKNQNFCKMKKIPGDIIILQHCTKNHDHILYCSWDMMDDRCNYSSFWAIFCSFSNLTARKIKIKKKSEKNTWRNHHFIQV